MLRQINYSPYMTILISIFCLKIPFVFGAPPEKMYFESLKIADQSVSKRKSVGTLSRSSALSSSMVKAFYGRYFQVGDHWDVAAWQIQNPTMRMTSDSKSLQKNISHGGIFHYEVISVKPGFNPEVTIQVTQLNSDGFTKVDSKVDQIVLKMNDQLIQSKKTYFFQGNPKGIEVSPDGLHIPLSSLELYPLDFPEISIIDRKAISALPSLPTQIESFASKMGFKPNLSQSIWFDQDDFFGRPIQILWQHGDPWPAYFKSSSGISILIRKGAR